VFVMSESGWSMNAKKRLKMPNERMNEQLPD